MNKIVVQLGKRSYPVLIGKGLIRQSGRIIFSRLRRKCRLALVTDRNVAQWYTRPLNRSLKRAGFRPKIIILPTGERIKSLATLNRLYNEFLSHRMERGSGVVALGGGVIGDIAGFAAASFMRGIDFIQIPTSLLAQVDSSVGGKVAINLPQGKNLIGAFYQPRLVIIDPFTLKTLPHSEFINGLAEVIKMAFIQSPRLVNFLKRHYEKIMHLDMAVLRQVIYQIVRIKTKIVEKDEREKGLRSILNYGHTIGHTIERLGKYRRYRHGEAISIGMNYAALLAQKMKLVSHNFVRLQSDLLQQYNLPFLIDKQIKPRAILEGLRFDKKIQNGRVRFVLPRAIGKMIISDKVAPQMIKNVLLQGGNKI